MAEHVKGQLRCLFLAEPCWMEAPWLPAVVNMLTEVPWQCPIIKDLIVDVSIGKAVKGLPYLHSFLWLLSDVFYTGWGSLPQSVRQNFFLFCFGIITVLSFCPLSSIMAHFLFHTS